MKVNLEKGVGWDAVPDGRVSLKDGKSVKVLNLRPEIRGFRGKNSHVGMLKYRLVHEGGVENISSIRPRGGLLGS